MSTSGFFIKKIKQVAQYNKLYWLYISTTCRLNILKNTWCHKFLHKIWIFYFQIKIVPILPVLQNFRHISILYILRSTNSRPVCHTVTDNYTRLTQNRHSSVYTSKDTIFSLSSGHGKCGVAVIRVSGTKSSVVLKSLGRFKELPKPRYAVLRTLYDQTENIPIDHGLVLWFPGLWLFYFLKRFLS